MVFLDYISVECMKRQNFDLSLRVGRGGEARQEKNKRWGSTVECLELPWTNANVFTVIMFSCTHASSDVLPHYCLAAAFL